MTRIKHVLILPALIFILLIHSGNLFAQQDANGWYWLNGRPTGNTLNWVDIPPSTSDFYALGTKGTFAKSTNGGSFWSINSQVGLFDAALSRRDLRAGVFFDANTGIVAGGALVNLIQGVVSKTTDGGASWTNYQYNDTSGSVNGMHFINANTGFICGGTRVRVHKTTDGGATWSDISTGLSGTNTYNAVHAIDENNIFLAFSTRRLYYSSNGGTSWSLITLPGTTGGTTVTDVYFKDANTGYACGNPNYFAYTLNGGSTWTQSNALSATQGQRDLNYSAGVLYMLGGSRSYLYKSSDDGTSWDSIRFYDSSNVNQPSLPTFNKVAVRGTSMAIVGSNGHVTVSTNGGSNWSSMNYSVNSGSNFYQSMTTLSPTEFWITSTGGVGSLLRTTDAGSTWTQIQSSHSVAIFQLDFGSQDTAYSCAGNVAGSIGQVAKSTNGGINWTTLPAIALNHTYLTLDFLNGSTGYVGGGGSGLPANIYKTTDGAATWITQALGYSASVLSVQMVDLNYGFALSTNFHRTINGGTNWVGSALPVGTWTNMHVLNKDVVFINGSTAPSNGNPVVYRTTDAGTTWTNVSGDMPDSLTVNRTEWINLYDGVAGFTGGLVGRTTNGGMNWSVSNPGFGNISDVALTDRNTWYAVSSNTTSYPIGRNTSNLSSISVNLNVGIEGFWNGASQVIDTVTVELRSSSSPYNVIDVAKTVFTPGIGYGSFEFLAAPAGSYYIVVKHRNSLETWSASPVSMASGGNYNYDFTSAASQSFGNNTILKLGRYCNYSGDVNQDGVIDGTDFLLVDNDILTGATGYLTTDLDGNNIVDGSDGLIVDNNSSSYIIVLTP
ncbi:MAG: hypothetical protein IPG02_12430 [Ignavibacteria bacterium]|nr:hypothetical protein [Ignavibacteria bacterium]